MRERHRDATSIPVLAVRPALQCAPCVDGQNGKEWVMKRHIAGLPSEKPAVRDASDALAAELTQAADMDDHHARGPRRRVPGSREAAA
jgi:hypothetical protein